MLGPAVSYGQVDEAPKPERRPLGDVTGAEFVELPIDDRWRNEVRLKLAEAGYEQWELGEHIKCSQANVSQTLSTKGDGRKRQLSSRYAHAIALAVGVPLPTMAVAMLAAGAAERNNDESFPLIVQGLALQQGVKIPK